MSELMPKSKNYAFIDSQNLNLAIQDLGWKLNWQRFRGYLRDKYQVEKAYIFVGFMEQNKDLYTSLTQAGYELIYKPVQEYKDGSVKGNIDAELVLQAMIDYNNYDQAVIVTGDGDFYCLVNYLYDQGKLAAVVAPNQYKFSGLLQKSAHEKITFMNKLRHRLAYTHKKKVMPETTSTPSNEAQAPPTAV